MTSQVKDPPKQRLRRFSQPLPETHTSLRFTKAGIFSLLILIVCLLLIFSGQLLVSLFQLNGTHSKVSSTSLHSDFRTKTNVSSVPTPTPTADLNSTSPLFTPGNVPLTPLQLPDGYAIIYQQATGLYLVSSVDPSPQKIPAEGYIYSEAVPPILTPGGQLLYAGNGIWMIDPFGGTPTQIAGISTGEMVTSMALSSDGTRIAWSTEREDGSGNINMYAGPLAAPSIVYQQNALNCPCFRIFSFAHSTGSKANNILLLTDDRGSNEAVQYGLWSLDLTQTPAVPQSILDENPQQGPLALSPDGKSLLYSSNEGAVPAPTDGSVPTSMAALSYANDLILTTLSGPSLTPGPSQTVLEKQDELSNIAQYHWVTTPRYSPDGHTLAYVEFSSDSQGPYDRHSALYTVQISGSGAHIHMGKPQLIATSTARLMELGAWFDNHIVTFYSDGSLYAMDLRTNALTTLAQPNTYANIVAVVGSF